MVKKRNTKTYFYIYTIVEALKAQLKSVLTMDSRFVTPKSGFCVIPALLLMLVALTSCAGKKVYKSDCDIDIQFKHIGFKHLLDSLQYYNNKYIEVKGKYKMGMQQSALYNEAIFVSHSDSNALWVNFTEDCPLFLDGTHVGLFNYVDGEYTPINNKKITIRGRINLRNKGIHGQFRATIDHVSLISM